MSKKKKEWRAEKERLLGLNLEDRRKDYRGNYVPLEKISTWANHDNNTAPEEEEQKPLSLADKVSLYKGDITILELDAIVNAANSSLLGGGGVDGCIHRAAGHLLYEECHSLNGCDTGKAKITCGYDLPAKYVIHTVGPIARGNVGQTQKDDLEACYKNSLKLMKDNNLRSVAFPCISTGIYGFPNEPAAEIALKTVRQWILDNQDEIDRVIFCVFLETDYEIYKRKMSDFFSPDNDDQTNEKDNSMGQENTEPKEGGEDDRGPDKKGAKDDDKKIQQGAKDDDKKIQQGAKDDDKKIQQGEKDDDKKIQQGAKDDDKSQPVEKDDDNKSQPDEKPDEEMMSQQEESNEDVPMESQKLDESSGGEPMEEEKPPEKKDPKVEPSPTAEKKLKQESKNEKEKKEGKGEDPQVAGDDKGGGPEKKMQTGQPDEPEKQMEDSKNADSKMETGQDTSDTMEVENADQSATAAKENNTTSSSSTKDDVKTQDESSQEPNAADNRPKSEDGQGDGNAQE